MEAASETQQAWIRYLQTQGLLAAENNHAEVGDADDTGPIENSSENNVEDIPAISTSLDKTTSSNERTSPIVNAGQAVPFSAEENSQISACVAQFCEQHQIALTEFPILLRNKQTNKRLRSQFWKLLKVDNRSASSVHKRVHRMYLKPAITEKWTPASDEQLAKLVEQFGATSWNSVAVHLKRSPEACRDRWRNYLVCGPERKSFAWTEEETAQLMSIVQASPSLQHINWGAVSAQMGHQRSRIQCRYRWNKVSQQKVSRQTQGQ